MNKTYIVRLTDTERDELKCMVDSGKAAAYRIKHANILLKIDADGPGWTDEQAAETQWAQSRALVPTHDARQSLVQ